MRRRNLFTLAAGVSVAEPADADPPRIAKVFTSKRPGISARAWTLLAAVLAIVAMGFATAAGPTTAATTAPAAPRYQLRAREPKAHHAHPVNEKEPEFRARFDAKGGRLMTTTTDAVDVWTVPTLEPAMPPLALPAPIDAADLSPDGTRLLTADGEGWLRVQRVGAADAEPLWGRRHAGGFASAVFSPDGRSVLIVERSGRAARVLDAATGKETLAILDDQCKSLKSASYTPDGTRVVTDGMLSPPRVWEAASGRPIATLRGSGYRVFISPRGDRIAQMVTDAVYVSDAATGRKVAETEWELRRDTQVANITAVAFSPDGRLVAASADDVCARIYDAATGRPVSGHFVDDDANPECVLFAPDGSPVLVTASRYHAIIWDTATGERIADIRERRTVAPAAAIGVAFAPDARYLAANLGEAVQLWERQR